MGSHPEPTRKNRQGITVLQNGRRNRHVPRN